MTSKRNVERRLDDLESRTRSAGDADHLDALAAESWGNAVEYIGGESGWERLLGIATDELGMNVERDTDVQAFHTAVIGATALHRLCNPDEHHRNGSTEDIEGIEDAFREQYPDSLEFERL